MPFWGSSTNQKNAQGALAELPRWLMDQAKEGWTNEAQAWAKANNLSDEQIANLRQQIQNGIGTPQDIRATGREIMPVGDLINRRMFRNEEQTKNYDDMPGVDTTIDKMDTLLGDKSKRIGENQEDIQGLIDTGFGSQIKRVGDTADTLGTDLAGTYGDVISESGKTFGDVRSTADQGFGAIKNDASGTYDQVRERINQGRDPALGTTARAFAPAMAATLRRIRAAGIDPNSPEAASLLARVDTARGRAFDDTMGRTLDQLNQADLSEQANNQGLDLTRLSNDQQLALQAAAAKQGLTLDEYLKRTDIATQTRDLQNALDQGKMGADITNKDTGFARGQDVIDEKRQGELISRGLRTDDVSNRNTLLEKQDAVDLGNQDLRNQEFNAGFGFKQADNAVKTQANAQLGDAANTQYQVSSDQGRRASGNAGQASQGFGTSYSVEQPSAGWGTKLLGGLATGALNYFAPGAGTAVGAATGAAPVNPWGSIFKKKPAATGGSADWGW